MTLDEFINKYNGKATDYDKTCGTQCFTKNHYILMANMTYKPIQDVCIGDKVIGYDENINTVTNVFKRKAETLEVKTDLGTLRVTKEHPFYFSDNTFSSILDMKEKVPELIHIKDKENIGLTDNELRFLGFWLGDGSLVKHNDNRNSEVRITFGKNKKEYIDSLNILSSYHERNNSKNCYEGRISAREHENLVQCIYECYNANMIKQLPLKYSLKDLELILEGLIHADGTKKYNEYVITNTSLELLFAIQAIAINLGYTTKSIREINRPKKDIYIKGKKVENIKPIYRLILNKNGKKSRRILEVKNIGIQEVYNIETDNTHTYICNNYKVHNCVDLVKMYCDYVLSLGNFYVGNAIDWYNTYLSNSNLKNNFSRIANTSSFIPQKGDIACFDTNVGGGYGHVAICTGEGTTSKFYSYDQNWNGLEMHKVEHNYKNFLGVLRPNNQTNIQGYKTGTYKVTTSLLNVRDKASIKGKAKKYNELTSNAREQNKKLGNEKANGYLKGVKADVTAITIDGNYVWGKTASGYCCINENRKEYMTKI